MTLENDEWNHDCVDYLKNKVIWQKQKSKYQIEQKKYKQDLHKAFCKGCIECPVDYQYLP